LVIFAAFLLAASVAEHLPADELSDSDMARVRELEKQRVSAIDRVVESVIAIYGSDRSGGGSGVIIHPSGIALTNHHVIMGAGVEGWGGISDGNMYKWKLIGTDPGGDVSIIQMEGRDSFPFSPLGDSDKVRVGDWALAMGNPFILTEDQSPTVTLGIVSGVKRYQPGAGQNQLEYGNCIQVDSSINPGNSGGPLFNLFGEVVGINGRGSFQDRGRVNVGLGYAISSNQIRNFIPELLATKLVEHATLDANFSNRDGKVVCSDLNLDAPIAQAGLQLGDELLEFEGVKIKTANQFTNLICTIPEAWPVSLKIRSKESGVEKEIHVRAFGLPYAKPRVRKGGKPKKDQSPEEKAQRRKQEAMIKLLSSPPGKIRFPDINQDYAKLVLSEWKQKHLADLPEKDASDKGGWKLIDQHFQATESGDQLSGEQTVTILRDGRFLIEHSGADKVRYVFDGDSFYKAALLKPFERMSMVEAKTTPILMDVFGIAAPLADEPFSALGTVQIDGSDRTGGDVAWRLRINDADEDPTIVWIEINRKYGTAETSGWLKKISADRDCDENGAVLYDQFEFSHGLAVPRNRSLVSGLDEAVTERLTLKSVEWVDEIDDSKWFDVLPGKEDSNSHSKSGGESEGDADQDKEVGVQSVSVRSMSSQLVALKALSQVDETASESVGFFQSLVAEANPKMVKVFGAGAGRVDGFATGIIVSDDGKILTTQGVFLDGRQVRVVTSDGVSHVASILKRNRVSQLALLKIERGTPDYFALSDEPVGQKGDFVVAMSNAFKVADHEEPLSATAGVISLRSTIEAWQTKRDLAYAGELVLIDAITSNPGAAGGAVVNGDGKLVGMIGKLINSSETNTRLNYAVPSSTLLKFVKGDLEEKAQKASAKPAGNADLGIVLFKLGGRTDPAYIDRVRRGTPARKAGLKPDDMVVSLGGETIKTVKDYENAIKLLRPDEEVFIIVKRGRELLRIAITPTEKSK
jgi:S1-C subfamily serine protease